MYTIIDDVQAHAWVIAKTMQILGMKGVLTPWECNKLIEYIDDHLFYLSDGTPYTGRVIYRIEDIGRGVTEMWGRVDIDTCDVYNAYTPEGTTLYDRNLDEWMEPL